jgi:gluconokinase
MEVGKIIVVMGVSACGKTTLGKALAASYGLPFFDGDDYHPPENITKMASGKPLQDQDRKGWLQRLNRLGGDHLESGAVIACSALKERYREWLSEGLEQHMVWVVINGSFEQLSSRIALRKGHFMPPELLRSQFDALEIPTYGIHLDAAMPIDEMVAVVRAILPS